MVGCNTLYRTIVIWIIILISLVDHVLAQMPSTYYGELIIGKVVKHKSELFYEVPPATMMVQLGQVVQTDGSKPWHQYWGYPRLERSIHFNAFGDADVLGYAIGAAPGIGFYMWRAKRTAMILHLHAGFAYLTREYDPATNPTNNAIGSNFNNTTQLKISLEKYISPHWMIDIGVGITHYSNGLSSSPNSGINVMGLHLGLKPAIAQRPALDEWSLDTPSIAPRYKTWGINGYISYGVAEYVVPGGPKYPIRNFTLGVTYQRSPFLRWHLGLDYDYSFGAYEFAIRDFQTEEQSRAHATRTAAYAAVEALFGDVSFRYQMGYYVRLIHPQNGNSPYSKFNISYYLPYSWAGVRSYIGILLKTHVAVADYVAIQAGVSW